MTPIPLVQLSNPNVTEQDVEEVQHGLEAVQIAGSEVQRLQEKQRAAVQRAVRQRPRAEDGTSGSPIHPDLQDLSFGSLGPEHRYARPRSPTGFLPAETIVIGICHRRYGRTRGRTKTGKSVTARFRILVTTNLLTRRRVGMRESRRARARAKRTL